MLSIHVYALVFNAFHKAWCVIWNHLVKALSYLRTAGKIVVVSTMLTSGMINLLNGCRLEYATSACPTLIIKLIRPYVCWPESCLVLPISLVLHLLLQVDKTRTFIDSKSHWLSVKQHVFDLVFDARGFEKAPRWLTSILTDICRLVNLNSFHTLLFLIAFFFLDCVDVLPSYIDA